jgi:hypothetical protein
LGGAPRGAALYARQQPTRLFQITQRNSLTIRHARFLQIIRERASDESVVPIKAIDAIRAMTVNVLPSNCMYTLLM